MSTNLAVVVIDYMSIMRLSEVLEVEVDIVILKVNTSAQSSTGSTKEH